MKASAQVFLTFSVPLDRNPHGGPAEELQQVSGGVHFSAEGHRGGFGRLNRRRLGLYAGPDRSEGERS